MKSLFLALLITASLFSQDMLQLYRSEGVDGVAKKFDRELTSVDYWKKVLAGSDLQFGYFESVSSFLKCNKERSVLSFYQREAEGNFTLQKTFNAYTGKLDGDKQREGDLKTPLGVYQLTKKLDKLDPFYGPLAFVTSYPNFYDRIQGKNGSGIWIHGLPDDSEREPYTRGCIAIENSDITCMGNKLDLEKSIVVIAETDQTVQSDDAYAQLLAELFRWRYAWIYNDLVTYLDFYSDDFIRHDGMDKKRFDHYKRQVFSYNDTKEILFKNINITPYPSEQKNLFLIWFDEIYHSNRVNFTGQKSLVVRFEHGHMNIIAEK